MKKSIPHDEAMAQMFADNPQCAVELMHELCQQANDLEDENTTLRRQVDWLARELEKESYLNSAEDWKAMAKKETQKLEAENADLKKTTAGRVGEVLDADRS